jgi:hypothetical protein
MKQYSLLFDGVSIEYTGYFKSVEDCIAYTRKRYKNGGDGILIRAVYPVVENEYYSVKTGKKLKTEV